jgi:hypothetical protein
MTHVTEFTDPNAHHLYRVLPETSQILDLCVWKNHLIYSCKNGLYWVSDENVNSTNFSIKLDDSRSQSIIVYKDQLVTSGDGQLVVWTDEKNKVCNWDFKWRFYFRLYWRLHGLWWAKGNLWLITIHGISNTIWSFQFDIWSIDVWIETYTF